MERAPGDSVDAYEWLPEQCTNGCLYQWTGLANTANLNYIRFNGWTGPANITNLNYYRLYAKDSEFVEGLRANAETLVRADLLCVAASRNTMVFTKKSRDLWEPVQAVMWPAAYREAFHEASELLGEIFGADGGRDRRGDIDDVSIDAFLPAVLAHKAYDRLECDRIILIDHKLYEIELAFVGRYEVGCIERGWTGHWNAGEKFTRCNDEMFSACDKGTLCFVLFGILFLTCTPFPSSDVEAVLLRATADEDASFLIPVVDVHAAMHGDRVLTVGFSLYTVDYPDDWPDDIVDDRPRNKEHTLMATEIEAARQRFPGCVLVRAHTGGVLVGTERRPVATAAPSYAVHITDIRTSLTALRTSVASESHHASEFVRSVRQALQQQRRGKTRPDVDVAAAIARVEAELDRLESATERAAKRRRMDAALAFAIEAEIDKHAA